MSNEFFINKTKDMSKCAKEIANLHQFENYKNALTIEEFNELRNKLYDYNPKSDLGISNKKSALNTIDNHLRSVEISTETRNRILAGSIEAGEKVVKNTVVFECHVRQPGFDKSFKPIELIKVVKEDVDIEVGFDVSRVKCNKRIIHKKWTEKIEKLQLEFLTWLKSISLKSGFLHSGMYLIPLSFVNQVDLRVEEFKQKRIELINEFGANYEQAIAESRNDLGDLFDERLVVPFEQLKASYRVESKYLTLNVAAALENINKELYQRELEKSSQEWASATIEIRDALRTAFQQLVNHFVTKLGKDDSGKPKTFHGSTVEKLLEFVNTFSQKNLVDDQELSDLADKAKKLLSGVEVKDIRSNDELRNNIEKAFSEILNDTNTLLTETRTINFED